MTQRERLIELIKNAQFKHLNIMWCEAIMLADELLENGVIVPPCKVGNKVYALWETSADLHICPSVVTEIRTIKRNCRQVTVLLLERMNYSGRKREYSFEEFGKTVFLTREEAEKALKECEK